MFITFFQFAVEVEEPAYAATVTPGIFEQVIQTVGFLVVAALLIGAVLWLVRFLLHHVTRARLGFAKVVFLVQLPKEAAEKKQEQERTKGLEEIREDVSISEAFFSALGGLKAEKGLKSWFTGRTDAFSFEIVAHEGLISYYVAAPKAYQGLLAQQIHAHFPNAYIEEVEDYNIFTAQGSVVGGYLTAKRHHLYPIKTYRKIETDPVEAINASLSRVAGSNEGAAIQYVIRSARKEWRRRGSEVALEMQKGKSASAAFARTTFFGSARELFKLPGKKKDDTTAPRSLSPLETEMQKAIQEKASRAGLDVTARVVAAAPTPERAKQIFDDVANAFAQYNLYEFGNIWKKVVPRSAQHLVHDFIYRTFEEGKATVLSADEVASLYHFPLPSDSTPNIRWLGARSAPPPVNVPREGLVLGKSVYRGEQAAIRLKREDRRRHVYIIGKSGVGKSVLMENMAVQDIEAGEGVCVVDPHGDLVEAILRRIPKARAEDVIVFDPSDTDRPLGLNMLEVKRDEQRDFAVQEMIAIFYKLFPPEMIGPMFEHNMRNVMLTLMADRNESGTIAEIPRMFSDPEFQKHWVSKVRDPVVRAFWEKEMAKTSDFHKSEMLGYLISKVGRFVENEMMRNIIGQRVSGFDLRDVMDKKKILLVNLSKGRTGEVNAYLLGLIIVSKLQMAALSRADLPEAERHDFYLYIDEFQNFITDSIGTILSEARKYRLNLIMAHQYMGQLVANNDTKVRDAILGNAGTMVVFRLGIEDAEMLEKEFAPTFNAYDLINIEKYTCYVKLLVDNTASKPFNMKTLAPPKGDVRVAAAIKQLSRLMYGRDKALVEAEILERSQLGATAIAPKNPIAERTL